MRELPDRPFLDKVTENQLEFLCRTYDFEHAYNLIQNWEIQGYDMDHLKRIYQKYVLEAKYLKGKRF